MSPEQVYAMSDDEYHAFASYQREEIREQKRAANRKRR